MMLGYLLQGGDNDGNDNDPVMLKQYNAESVVHSDKVQACMATTGRGVTIAPLPLDMLYPVDKDLHAKLVKRHRGAGEAAPLPPIKVGFVACSFNSKAILYLSHDMFRFFDPDLVDVTKTR
jgi:hypothetical protein